jgi:2,6-dihydroxypyridine 3-monooxygenase
VSSLARARLLPEVRPSYSGYVAWRGTVPERTLPAATRELFGDAITYQVLKDSHILVYPIPGPGGIGGVVSSQGGSGGDGVPPEKKESAETAH